MASSFLHQPGCKGYLVLCNAVDGPGVYVSDCSDTLAGVHVVDLKCLVGTAHKNNVCGQLSQ